MNDNTTHPNNPACPASAQPSTEAGEVQLSGRILLSVLLIGGIAVARRSSLSIGFCPRGPVGSAGDISGVGG